MLNESRQRHSSFSAFQSQSSLNNQNFLHKPMPLIASQQQHPPRPMSCISSLNHTNEFSSLNTDQTNSNLNPSTKSDKFAERLNAMLNYDQLLQDDTIAGCLSKSSSLANFQQLLQANSINKQFNQSTSNRSLNAQMQNSSAASNESLMNLQNYSQSSNHFINKHAINNQDFNSQIQELSNKNMQAQQKLKSLQFEQHQINQKNNNPQHQQHQNNFASDANQKQKVQRDALEKLKREQLQLKEQISSLNKQRESAQNELEVLATSSSSSLRNNDAQNAIMKHLSQLNENVLSLEHEINNNTPSLSPIQLENNFQRLNN